MTKIKKILKNDITILLVGSSMAFAGTPTTLEKTVDIPATSNYASSRVLSYTDDADNGDSSGNNTYSQRRLP